MDIIKNKKLHLILGNQLFLDPSIYSTDTDFLMIESIEISSRYKYHKFKLAFIFTWMREFSKWLENQFPKSQIYYYFIKEKIIIEDVLIELSKYYSEIQIFKIVDKSFEQYLLELLKKYFKYIEILESNYFINQDNVNNQFLDQNKGKIIHYKFYVFQRKRLGILLKSDHTPLFDRWSFDEENRKKIPKDLLVDNSNLRFSTKVYKDVIKDVDSIFSDNFGILHSCSWLPLNTEQLDNFVCDFFERRFINFGPYEDAISHKDFLLFHSGFSALFNIGILTPKYVLNKMNIYLNKVYGFDIYCSTDSKVSAGLPISSIEGFIRQIIGWREFINLMYRYIYSDNIDKYNFFNHTNSLSDYFWTYIFEDEIKLNTPLVNALTNVYNFSFCHHIERLMVIANWMNLNEYNPVECFNWFMSMFVDAYEWVMVPNVIGMGLFADGGLFATKPYIAGGNYLRKMSDFKDWKYWERTWTNLFWKFINKHSDIFSKLSRLSVLSKYKR